MEPERPTGPHSEDPGQRRHVTLLFSDLCGYTELNELLDPEDSDALRRQIERQATAVIHKHGGAVSQYYGDGILAVFGLPSAAEHDVRAAVNAAVELRALTHSLEAEIELPKDFQLAMHFGVHCGVVFARMGDPLHGRYELTGDAVNTAARLCAAAERDEILVSEVAMLGIEPFFEADVREDLTLKGKRLSVPAYRVRALSDVRTRFEASARRGLTEFVNRTQELAQLAAAVHGATQNASRTVALIGGPGIGKTRVLEEFTRRHAGECVRFYRGACESYGSVVPLQPLVQILRQIFELRADWPKERALPALRLGCLALGSKLEGYVELFARVLALEPGAQQAVPRRLIEALCALIRCLPASLVLLAIDDWQWVDDLSHQVLRGMIRELDRGLLVLLVAREHKPNDILLEAAERIELRPLPEHESTRVIRSLLPNVLDLGLRDSLCERAGGNPLFLEELCRSLCHDLSGGVLALEQCAVPHTIHGVIQTRLQRLPAQELELVRTASVIGNEFAGDLLIEVAGHPDVGPALERLVAADLLRPSDEPDGYRFKHGITREVVYESVRRSERRLMHAAVASCLERRAADSGIAPPHEALAHHHLGSGNHARAALHAELAGDSAAAASALDRARLQYGAALSELDKLPQDERVKRRWLAVSVKWARAWVYSQAPEQLVVLDRAKRHAEELSDLQALCDVEQMAAWICYALGEQERAIQHCQRGLALAQQIGNPKLTGQLISNLGQSHAAAGEYAPALELLQRAMQLKRDSAKNRERTVPVGFAYALAALASIHADQGAFAEAQAHMSQALDAVRGRGHAIEASVLALAAMNEHWQGQWQRAIETCERARVTSERICGPYVFSICEVISSFCRFMLERRPEDRARVCSAAEWLRVRGMGLYLSMVYACAAEACWLARDVEAATVWAERALGRAARKDPFGQATAYRVLAQLRVLQHGAPDAAVYGLLDNADKAAASRGSRREAALNAWTRARVALAAGDTCQARQGLERARGEFEAMGMDQHCACVDTELGA